VKPARVVRHTLVAAVDWAPSFYADLFGWEPPTERGAPTRWRAWFYVEDVDERARRAEALGGRAVVAGAGAALVADRQGAELGLTPEPRAVDPPGRFDWDELMTSDVADACRFYREVLGWTSEETGIGPSGPYTYFAADGEQIAGVMEKLDYLAEPTWLPYVPVEDIHETARRARELDAQLAVEPTPVIDYGLFAVMADPAGALIGLARPD
jgi:predicted enzyme related to lactoylglutathione lyase